MTVTPGSRGRKLAEEATFAVGRREAMTLRIDLPG
jgi:hypothetical protein